MAKSLDDEIRSSVDYLVSIVRELEVTLSDEVEKILSSVPKDIDGMLEDWSNEMYDKGYSDGLEVGKKGDLP